MSEEWRIFVKDLEHIAADHSIVDDLIITMTKTDAVRTAIGSGSSKPDESPILFNERASDALSRLRGALWAIAVHTHNQNPHTHQPENDAKKIAEWLLLIRGLIREDPKAGKICSIVRQRMKEAMKAVDRPPDLLFIGPCVQCERNLYARQGKRSVSCCSLMYDVDEQRSWMESAVDDQVAGPGKIVGILRANGTEVTADAIRSMARRKRIQARDYDDKGRPMYRVGDVRVVTEKASE